MDDLPTDFEGSLGGPPTNQITGASDTTVNESSVTLDPAVRTVGALQVVQDTDPAPQEGEIIFTTNSKFCWAMCQGHIPKSCCLALLEKGTCPQDENEVM